jgi:hypothetical protein
VFAPNVAQVSGMGSHRPLRPHRFLRILTIYIMFYGSGLSTT